MKPAFLAAALLLAAVGCGAPARREAAAAAPAPAAGSFPPAFVREVAPFAVRDSAGRPYELPFLGGLNVPRPQFIDIDGDGDLDLFIQEASNRLMFIEQTGTPQSPHYVWRTDRYQDLEIGEWFRFVDMDADGDYDLLAEQPFSYIRYYRNDGTRRVPRFVVAADTLRDDHGTPIFSDRQNIPQVADIDGDGKLDLFIGKLIGTVTRYEEIGRDSANVPRFHLLTDRFEGIEIVAQFGSLHGANTMAMADADGDGDLDFFWGDFFEAGVLLIENTGSATSPVLRNQPVQFPRENPILTSGYNAPVFGDVDGDGDLDFFSGVLGGAFNPNKTTIDNFYFLERLGPGRYVERSRRYLSNIDVGSESVPALADIDGDGDLDLILSNKIDPQELETSRIFVFENRGSATSPSFQLTGKLPITGTYHYAPAFADLDGDGDLDLVLGTWRNVVMYYRNDGTPRAGRWVLQDSALVEITRGSNTTPALGDLDGDGDLDLMVGEASGTLNYYRNDGTPTEPKFVLVSDSYAGIDVGRRSAPAFADLDGDGDLDLVVGAEKGELWYFRNGGSRTAPAFDSTATAIVPAPPYPTPALADIDGDGRLELFLGTMGGGVQVGREK